MKNATALWIKAALIRALRTFAEAMLAYIGTGTLVLKDVNWLAALSAGAIGAISAILLAIAGLPEVNNATVLYVPTDEQFVEEDKPPEADEEQK